MLVTGAKLRELALYVFGDQLVRVGPSSVDLTLGNEFLVGGKGARIELGRDGKPDYIGFQRLLLGHLANITFEPGYLYIAHSAEYVRMPPGYGAFLALRSTAGRRGLDHLHAGWIEPGWEGQVTFELSPAVRTEFRVGERIAQLVFFKAEGLGAYQGQYQGQRGPTIPGGE